MVLQLTPLRIIGCNKVKVVLQPEDLEDRCIGAHGHGRRAFLDAEQRHTGDPGCSGDRLHLQPAAQSGQP